MKCVICKETIRPDDHGYDGGCNAEPVAEGQCCDPCDKKIVIPARLAEYGLKLPGGE